ncbi:unnamed protein product [Larinioides sclopetarius]|uniref:Kinesin-like protein n=1 Tax=Larinioides sclopetarius TaxID=280406 RepID=A0AAV1ZTV4_9ARAC
MATENIVVAVRMRPLIPREIEKNEIYWKAEPPTTICQINTSDKPAAYSFDHVFDSKVENGHIYKEICSGIVRSVINGFNGTIFAYGQTSSGKTFTMLGDKEKNVQGIMHYAIDDIFELIQNMTDREFLLRVSYMEIYNETVRDLFTGEDNLKLQEENGQIKVIGLQEKLVQKPEQILHFMKNGECRRRTGETRMNEKSSRSHAIFRMIIESCVRGVEDAAVNVSQFNLVDLAGSERARHTGATGTRFKESVKINQSLLSLGQVIRQLSENENQFISYRDSKLTRILQNSLGGNSLTAIICTVTAACFDETQSTLKFAEQAKHIRNKPLVNEVLTEQALLKQYANKIKKLTAELEATKEEKSQQNRDLQEKIKYLEKQFVFQMHPLKAKSNRRETWGGALDAARFRLQIASQDSFKNRPSFSRSRVGSCNLSILEEQCEDTDGDDMYFPHLSAQQFKGSKRSSNSKRTSNLLLTADVAVQVEPVTLSVSPQLYESELDKMKIMAERISYLEKELAELREFTTLERQIMESCSSSLDGKAMNLNPEEEKEKVTDLRHNFNSQDILQMEIVQDAVKKARDEGKELLLTGGGGGSGPANSMQCYYLQAKLNKKTLELNKKNEELNSLKIEMAKLKKLTLKQNFETANELFRDIKGVEGNTFTPYTNPDNPLPVGEALHPKMQRRKVLKETNRKHIAPFPSSKEEIRKERINDENFNPFNIPISLEVLKTNKSTVPDKHQADKDKAAETQRQIEMLFGAPQWPWE